MQMAEASEQAFMTFWNGNTAAKEESLSRADALQQQHALVTCSSRANAKRVFLSPPAGLAPEHTGILNTIRICLSGLGHCAAADSIFESIDVIEAEVLQ